jgi:hypothetical protein
MHELLNQIGSIADRIKALEKQRERLGKFLKEIKDRVDLRCGDLLEPNLVYRVEADPLKAKRIIAIDGGLSQHAYHGLDMILTRAVAVIFNYEGGSLKEVGYYPHALVSPKLIIVADPYSDEEFAVSTSLERQRTEIELAATAAKEFSPDLLLLDGSVVPHGNHRPSRSSNAYDRYTKVLESFRELYDIQGMLLAGCVEDSRGRRFCEITAKEILGEIDNPRIPELQKILAGTRDTNLLFHVLEKGERTCVFKYTKSAKEHPVLSDIGAQGDNVYCFYMKTAEFDRPLRIDFYAAKDPVGTANRIAPLVLATACHSCYGFPAPLIEADFRAKLQEQDVSALHDQLVDRVGITPSLMKLRREQRPF